LEQTLEEEYSMRRLRLASLALACGLLSTLSGCCAFCEDGRMFPRLFRSSSQRPILDRLHGNTGSIGAYHQPECDCQHGAHMPAPDFQGGQIFTMPPTGMPVGPTPIPITNIPASQPPNILKVPQAAPTPYFPGS
jgi:hypothetical protein